MTPTTGGTADSRAEQVGDSTSLEWRLGQVGYIAKGIALSVVGGLLAYATVTFDRQTAQGLDGALQTILAQPFGWFLLTAVALGFVAFGLFAILQSRYRRM